MTDTKKISTFEVIEEIGHGGMADIIKATQPSLQREVVLKKLKNPTPDLIERFKREAMVAASFNQDNIVATHDFFIENDDYYLVLEFVDGLDLNTIISLISPLPLHIAAMIIREVARGLEYAHDKNVIHRDIKPGNVMISYNGDVKIIDFGLVKNESPTNLTRTDVIIGTPFYIAPEQLNGEEITPQSDIYSLGVMLYEMVTGLKPFSASSNTELFTLISQGKYTPPQKFFKNIPLRLVKIINKAMHQSIEKRYQCISEFIKDVNKFLKWENQVNIKHQLSHFMSHVKLASNDKTVEFERPSDMTFSKVKPRSWKPTLAIASFILIFGSLFFGVYEMYMQNNYGKIFFNINVADGEMVKDGEHSYEFKDGKIELTKLLPGPHSFRVSAGNDYSIFESELQIKSGINDTINVELIKKHSRALLTLNSEPNGAHIYINDQLWGKTPIKQEKVTVGTHKIEVVLPGYERWKALKEFRTDEDLHILVNLAKADLSAK